MCHIPTLIFKYIVFFISFEKYSGLPFEKSGQPEPDPKRLKPTETVTKKSASTRQVGKIELCDPMHSSTSNQHKFKTLCKLKKKKDQY